MGVSRKIAEETGIPHPLPQLEFESICSLNDLIIIIFFPPQRKFQHQGIWDFSWNLSSSAVREQNLTIACLQTSQTDTTPVQLHRAVVPFSTLSAVLCRTQLRSADQAALQLFRSWWLVEADLMNLTFLLLDTDAKWSVHCITSWQLKYLLNKLEVLH